MCMHVYRCVCPCPCVLVWEQRMLLSSSMGLYFWRQESPWTWCSFPWLLASKPLGCDALHLHCHFSLTQVSICAQVSKSAQQILLSIKPYPQLSYIPFLKDGFLKSIFKSYYHPETWFHDEVALGACHWLTWLSEKMNVNCGSSDKQSAKPCWGMEGHTCNPSVWEGETRGSAEEHVQPGLHTEALS